MLTKRQFPLVTTVLSCEGPRLTPSESGAACRLSHQLGPGWLLPQPQLCSAPFPSPPIPVPTAWPVHTQARVLVTGTGSPQGLLPRLWNFSGVTQQRW